MTPADAKEFCAALDDCNRLLSRGKYSPDARTSALFFKAVERYPLDAVRWAIARHVEVGKFEPVPAELIALIEAKLSDDGRPGHDEAWSVAVTAGDERKTVVWTAETAQAMAAAQPLLAIGDEVAARMAFKEVYIRIVREARAARIPVVWSTSEGADPEHRKLAIGQAVAAGLLEGPKADDMLLLPGPRAGSASLESLVSLAPPEAREKLLELKAVLMERANAASIDEQARELTRHAKEIAAQKAASTEPLRAPCPR